MKHRSLVTAMVVAPLLLTGCMRQMASKTWQPNHTSVAVRFVSPPDEARFVDSGDEGVSHVLVDSQYNGFSVEGSESEMPGGTPGISHVALWGGPFEGLNVTWDAIDLTPGSYTFAHFGSPEGTVMQGWLEIRNTGSDIVNALTKWRDNIPQQKQRLAWDFEIYGHADSVDADTLKSFNKQISALNKLERRLNAAVAAEVKAHQTRVQRVGDLLRAAEIKIMPGEEPFFHPTTRSVFSEQDLIEARAGNPVTKIVLAADHENAQWKLRRVNHLYDDLQRCKEVFRQEADRLERRQGLLLLTDHLYNHDRRFVENEMRLQQTLGSIDDVNQTMSDLRERRMALAFFTALFTPDASFAALDQEERDLLRERTVFQADRRRLDALFNDAEEDSAKRVALERSRQRVAASIVEIDGQLESLGEARTALVSMNESTSIMHRQNQTRLLAAAFVGDDLPVRIRQAVERESLMTVRLQASDSVFAPRPTSVASAEPPTAYSYWHSHTQKAETSHSHYPAGDGEHDAVLARHRDSEETWTSPQEKPAPDDDDGCNCPFIRLLVPPCWFADRDR